MARDFVESLVSFYVDSFATVARILRLFDQKQTAIITPDVGWVVLLPP